MPQTNPAKFFTEVKSELQKVTWPTKNEVTRLTMVVVIISLIVGVFVSVLDLIFTQTITLLLKR